MHKVANAIRAAVAIPLLHIADSTADAILETGIRDVGLLGTRFTMEQDFYGERIEARGLRVLVPPESDRRIVDRIIYEELCVGEVREASRNEYRRIIRNLIATGANGVILGCTEIGLLIGPDDSPVPVFDKTSIHAQAAVDFALAVDSVTN